MKTIYKYELKVCDEQHIEIPAGAKTLSVQLQNGKPCLWALVDTNAVIVKHLILTFGTGQPLPKTPGDFVGTYQLYDGAAVFHVFEGGSRCL